MKNPKSVERGPGALSAFTLKGLNGSGVSLWLPEETESITDPQQLDRHIWTGTNLQTDRWTGRDRQVGSVFRSGPDSMAEETRVIYHLEDQETPYLIRINVPAQRVTLADFKQVLNKPNLKFFFKSVDDDFGVVKEEISDDDARLPFVNGRVVCWLVSAETCQSDFRGSDLQSIATPTSVAPPPIERTGGIGDSRPPSFHAAAVIGQDELMGSEVNRGECVRLCPLSWPSEWPRPSKAEQNGAEPTGGGDSSSTQQSSQLETTSFCSSEEDSGGGSANQQDRAVPRRDLSGDNAAATENPKHNGWRGSVTDSTMSLNVITVTLNMERYNFLGISIVGQSNDRGDGGIYIGSIMKGGAVAADGRIEPGDMLLQSGDVTVAKCWDPNPRDCFTLPRSEPVRPIDPAAWVSHTAAMTGSLPPHYSVHEENPLTIHSDMTAIVKAMLNPESGLEVRDRMWLKITIPNAFIGSDVVCWLHRNVEVSPTAAKLANLGLMSLLDPEDAPGPGGPDGDLQAPGSGLQWPPAFPYQYPVSSPVQLPSPPASGGGEGGGGQHSDGERGDEDQTSQAAPPCGRS
ncbi:Segment polarity protein dishevelled-like protein DVL-3 [Larimichthys crocea]|uniref:Segment polarity protein dishevelled-like protein DVL-3 n=1 Tax=Larimichthys crocea TaxID=215358 RepID=A0A6G0IU61_LARCR|nr:Segment polarity protein dishevelled-like protein DVL-3 [Larimichthys crocea]